MDRDDTLKSMLRNLFLSFFLLFGIGFQHPALADDVYANDRHNIMFSRLSVDDGLSQAGINSLIQDKYGYIWIGTQEGLNRYDGNEIVVYEHDRNDPQSLSNNWIWTMVEDDTGMLWIGTDGGGLEKLNPDKGTFIHYRHNPDDQNSISHNRVRALYHDHEGDLWIGTDGGGLNRFDPATGHFQHYRFQPGNLKSLPSDSILAIREDRYGVLWIGTNGGGLARLDRNTGEFIRYRHDPDKPNSLSSDYVRVIYEDKNGRLFIGTYEGGLNIFNRETDDFTVYRHKTDDINSLGHNRIRDILQDANGTYWIATDHGLSEWRRNEGKFFNYNHDPTDGSTISDDRLTTLYQDRGGVLWVGSYNGLNKWNYASEPFRYLQETGGIFSINNNIITAIEGSTNGEVWVGTYGGGVNRINLKQNKVIYYDSDILTDSRIMALYIDEEESVWIGTRSGGLNRLDPISGKVKNYLHTKVPGSISSNSVSCLYGEANGVLWVGTYGGGLNRFDVHSGKFTVFKFDSDNPQSISNNRITDIFRDSKGILWVGTEGGGLNRYDDATRTFQRFQNNPNNPKSISSNFILKIHEGIDGSLWIATNGGGLNQISLDSRRTGRIDFTTYGKHEGLASDTIQGILDDKSGNLWLSSNRGLMRFSPGKQIKLYNHLNGLKSDEFNSGAQYRSQSGYMFFGGSTGLLMFHPNDIKINTHKPDIVIQAFDRNGPLTHGYSIDPDPPVIELGYKDDLIIFKFAALDFSVPSKNQYRYKLEGFDNDWTVSNQLHHVTYTNLKSGHYQFFVQAANNDGIWNNEGSSISINVLPPPWKTVWAYIGYFLTIAVIIGFYIHRQRYKYFMAVRKKEELERLVSLRTREIEQRNTELIRLNDMLRNASFTDSLTGLKNRRFLHDFIETEITNIDRKLTDLTINQNENKHADIAPGLLFMMIDLDGFKQINDNYGHQAGDEALKQVTDILESCCRQSDIIIRWGGDEFLIIGRNANYHVVEKLAERVRIKLAEHQYQVGGGISARMSGSIGFALYPFIPLTPAFCSWEQIIALADSGAYLSKQNGRNAWVGLFGTNLTHPTHLSNIQDELEELVKAKRIKLKTSISGELTFLKPPSVKDVAL